MAWKNNELAQSKIKKFESFDSNFSFLSLLVLVFGKNDSVKVATDKVTENRACVYSEEFE